MPKWYASTNRSQAWHQKHKDDVETSPKFVLPKCYIKARQSHLELLSEGQPVPSNDDPDDQLLKSWNSAARKRAMVCIDVIFDRNCESGEIIWGQFGNEWTFHFLFHFEGMAVGHEMFRIHNFDKYSWYYFDPAWLKLELPKSRKVASPLHSIFDQFPQVKTFGIYNAPNNEILIQNTKYAETKCFSKIRPFFPFLHCLNRLLSNNV